MSGASDDRAEAAARWLLSLPPEVSASVVERLSRETLQGIRGALCRLGDATGVEPETNLAGVDADGNGVLVPERLDGEPPFLLAAILAATPAGGRDATRAAIADRRGDDVLATIDGYGTVVPMPHAAAVVRSHVEDRP